MSKCKNGKFGMHDFVLKGNTKRKIIEVCKNCGEVIEIHKDDNKSYHDAHQKDFIQPADPRFKEIYN